LQQGSPVVEVPSYIREEYIDILQTENAVVLTSDEAKYYVNDFLLWQKEKPTANLRTLLDNAERLKPHIQQQNKQYREVKNQYQTACKELSHACDQYFKTRAQLYWLSDIFDGVGGALFSCFGYQTEKQKRAEYLNNEVNQGLRALRDLKRTDLLSAAIANGLSLFRQSKVGDQGSMHTLLTNMQKRVATVK